MGRKKQPTQKLKMSKREKELREQVDELLRITTLPLYAYQSQALDSYSKIGEVLDRINYLERGLNNAQKPERSSDRNENLDKFVEWLKENQAELHGCSIAEFDGYGYGIKSNVEIAENSLLITVPRKLMLVAEDAYNTELKHLIERTDILTDMSNVLLAIYLLHEKYSENSIWKPYFDVLPKTYSTVLYFTKDELDQLKGTTLTELALRQIRSIARQYSYFYKLFNTSDDSVCQLMRQKFTYRDYCWAVSTVMTRQNLVPSKDGNGLINALIPLWDMFNHTNGQITTDYNPEQNRCECVALKDFKAGEQVFIHYGPRTNADFFLHNGFIYEENENDTYPLQLGISKSDQLRDKRTKLLGMCKLSPVAEFAVRKGPRPVDGKLLAFLRIFNMNEEQLDTWLENEKPEDLFLPDTKLDPSLENKAWSFLQIRLKLLLSAFKTTIEDDEKMLWDKDLSENSKMAIKMRLTEKRLLSDTLEYIKKIL